MSKGRKLGKPTIADVAEKVGVSSITVSRAISSPSKVSKKLQKLIQHAIKEINYVPDLNAQALASGRTNIIGVIIPSLSNNIFSDVLKGIYELAEQKQYRIIIGNTRYSSNEETRLIKLFMNQGVSGLIITGIDQQKTVHDLLKNVDYPIVQIMEYTDNPIDMLVGFDHFAGMYELITHILDQGYKKIASITARLDPRVMRRMSAYKQKLIEHQIYDPKLQACSKAPSSVSLGKQMALELLLKNPDIDAIVCCGDDLALGCLSACTELGLNVPEQIGISGFNDLEFMQAMTPPLTSVQTFREEIGYTAIDMILKRINKEEIPQKAIDIGYKLQKRKSTIN
ncbi:MAG: LacI family DNA-binding transcriptional regulator [Rhizobiales bacterium]|nr:LacI family DNA-binding transcriptional regulator [Hyphomicrobiales bacterium]